MKILHYKVLFETMAHISLILPFLCECKLHRITNFKFSENLRPKKQLVDPGPLSKDFRMMLILENVTFC